VDSDITVALRDYDDSIVAAYQRLFPGDPDKSPGLLNWRFGSNPHGRARFAVATRSGQPVGMIALVPTRLANASGSALGFQAIDTIVDPSCQGRGLFVKMGSLAQDPAILGGDVLSTIRSGRLVRHGRTAFFPDFILPARRRGSASWRAR
jgi:hypothetical protein